MSIPTFRLFLSSPGDVAVERRRVAAIVSRINGEFAGRAQIETIRWETENYQAHATFQTQIPEAVECDIVLTVFKWRLGTELPPEFPDRMDNGEPYPSGTAYELLTSIAKRQHGAELPDVFVYRYGGSSPRLEIDDPNRARIERDWAVLKGFFDRWFLTPQGHFKAAFHTYQTEDEFESEVERLLRRWLAEKVAAGRVVAWPDAIKGSPFPGLEAYGYRHASVFFGRARDVARAVEAWQDGADRGTPFLTVVGSSGAGKSSLARAGLVPRLTTAGVAASVDLWRVAAMRPGDSPDGPVAGLASALLMEARDLPSTEDGRGPALPEIKAGDARTPAELAELLAHGSRAAARAAVNALDRVGGAARETENKGREVRCDLLLLVDQLDELFAPSMRAEDRDAFVQILTALLASGRVWIATTLRADLYAAMLEHPGLKALKEAGASYDLAPPGPAELAEIVRRPAAAAALDYDQDPATGEGLDERLLREADRPDMLPLVQLALARLYEGRRRVGERTILPLDVYAGLGGLPGIIDEAGERALASLGPAEAARLPQLVRSLAELDGRTPLTGKLTVRSIPLARAAPDDEIRRLVEALAAARLLTLRGAGEGGSVRLAHQRVLSDWARAREIVAGSADFYRIRADVERQRMRWEKNRRGDLLLPRGLPLAEAENILQRYGEDLPPEIRAFIKASRARAGRAQLVTAAAAVVFALVAAGALFQWWVAREQTRLAERNFGIAREAVRNVVFNIVQGLGDVSGMRVDALKTILTTVQVASDQLIETAPGDPGLLRARAAMFDNFSKSYLTVGDVAAARASAERGVEVMRRLLKEHPEDNRVEGDLSVLLVTLGDVVNASGDLSAATRLFEEALTLARSGAVRAPDDPKIRQHVAAPLNRLGSARLAAGDQAGAIAAYDELLAISRREVAAAPDAGPPRQQLATTLSDLAYVQLESGQVDRARAHYEEAAAISRALVADFPANDSMLGSLSIALSNLGELDLKLGKPEDAVAKFQQAVDRSRDLARRDPGNADRQRTLAISLEKRGNGAFALSDWVGALQAYSENLTIFRTLAAMNPLDIRQQRSVSVGLSLVASVKRKTGDTAAAEAAYAERLAIVRDLAKRQPGNADAQRDLATGLQDFADVRTDAGDPKAALAAYREAADLMREVSRLDASNVRGLHELAVMLLTLQGLQQQAQDSAGALASLEEAAGILHRLIELRPEATVYRRDLGVALLSAGLLRMMADDRDASLSTFEEAVGLFRGLFAAGDEVGRRRLDVALDTLGKVSLVFKDTTRARAAFKELVDLRRSAAAGEDAASKIALASALVSYARVTPDPAIQLREAAALLDGLADADRTDPSRALRADIAQKLGGTGTP